MKRSLPLLAISLVAFAGAQAAPATQAASASTKACRWQGAKIVHGPGERCIQLRRSRLLVTVRR